MNASAGIAMKVMAALSSTLMLACVKQLDGAIPVGEVIFFRSLLALVPLLIWLRIQGSVLDGIRTRNIGGHVVRGLAGTGGLYFSYLSLLYISLTDATAINYAAPLFTVLLAALLLREKVRHHRWVAVFMGFTGILVMFSGHLSLTQQGSFSLSASAGILLALMAAFCTACALVQIRFLNGKEKPGAIAFWFAITTALTSLVTLPAGWKVPQGNQLALLVGCGLLGGITQILMTLSLRYAEASLLAPFDYTTLIWSVAVGYLLLGSLPDSATVVGAILVVTGGLYAVLYERYRFRKTQIVNVSS
ncbi:DMT family transporter [Pantoea sp. Sc1]|uniref:DMT family transporter n=1 Tax=Pantoea sp. Sc1 TaxID=593105 RepID=UPI00025859A6|nr:DMT family transporter [Pantoea sp. Sc1]EIB96764.1 DMT superfamily transporter [Pantoea sp. Sc1]